MAPSPESQATAAISEYTPRATGYDAANAGWHAELADDFISWLRPQPGDAVLDVACGTGLVTLRAAEQVGPDGIVVGVDVTKAMLDVAREKVMELRQDQHQKHDGTDTSPATATVDFLEADIADEGIRDLDAVKEVVSGTRGGFDVVSCCSALVLLERPADAVKLWAGLLKSGGRMVLDVATERKTIQYLSTETLGREVGVQFPFSRAWVKGKETVEKLMTDAGMEIETSLVTRSYLPEKVYEREQAGEVFENEVLGKLGKVYVEKGLVEEARTAWMKVWDDALEDDGKFHDGHWLYVCVGRKL